MLQTRPRLCLLAGALGAAAVPAPAPPLRPPRAARPAALVPATVAQASTTSWTSLPGLTPADGANWPRFFFNVTSDPLTFYAGDEDNGVFRSTNDGVSWNPFSSGLGQSLSIR